MKEETKEARGGGPCELIYADALVLTAQTAEEVFRWWALMEQRGLRTNDLEVVCAA